MAGNDWVIAEPGRLVLSGTRFSIRHERKGEGPWKVFEDNVQVSWSTILAVAKLEAERRQAELVEVGLE